MSSKLVQWAGAAATTLTMLSSQAFGLEECRGPQTAPEMSAKQLAVTLGNTSPDNWPAIAQYPDDFLSDVRVELRSAVDIQRESDAAKKSLQENYWNVMISGQAIDLDVVKADINPLAHYIIDALEAKDIVTQADVEQAKKDVGNEIYNARHAAANDLLTIMQELPYCPPVVVEAEPANTPS